MLALTSVAGHLGWPGSQQAAGRGDEGLCYSSSSGLPWLGSFLAVGYGAEDTVSEAPAGDPHLTG